MRRVLVTDAGTPVALAFCQRVAERPDIEQLVLVDDAGPDLLPIGDAVMVGESYEGLRDLVVDQAIDTVVHAAMAPGRMGDPGRHREAGVIATMHVAAIVGDLAGPVRTLVALSSTARYRPGSGAPIVQREGGASTALEPGSYEASLAEAEAYLIALADQRPNLSVSILRFADLIGPGVTSPLARLLGGTLVPRYAGFDPMVQFLHVDDAVAAIEHAGDKELAGTYNVASGGAIRWGRAARLAGGVPVPTVPAAAGPVSRLLRTVGLPVIGPDATDVLRYGRVVSTERIEATGFEPDKGPEDCIRSLLD